MPGTLPFMTVTASSGSTRVNPQLYDTLPLSSVRQAEQQDRFPDGGELRTLITFFQSGQTRVEAAQRITANAAAIVARAANRIFVGGTPLSYLDAPLTPVGAGDADLALKKAETPEGYWAWVPDSWQDAFKGGCNQGSSS